jgi:hypothetical protein
MQTRRDWSKILKFERKSPQQPKILYPAKLSFQSGEIKTFLDKQKVENFVAS